MTTYVEDITQALVNLGGQAKLDDIYNEVQRIRTVPLPKYWLANIRGIIENNCSDSTRFLGKEHFHKVDRGTYGLIGQGDNKRLIPAQNKDKPKQKPHIYTVSDSMEIISNTLRTIKEYREYSDPNSPTWMEYLKKIFHVLGFQTTEAGARLLLLRTLGEIGAATAIVSIVLPGESFEVVGSEIQWETYLCYAANYHHVDWGILTDGIQLQAFDYGNHWDQSTLSWQDLDEIITKFKSII